MDPFSTAASAVGIASIGIQVAESIHGLSKFCKSIRDAPEAIHTISEDLALLNEILNSFMTYYQTSQRRDDSATAQPAPTALTVCLTRLRRLERMTSKLEKQLTQNRAWGGLKTALKEDSIEKFQSSLEKAKTSLILATLLHQGQSSSLVPQQRRSNSVMDQLAVVEESISNQENAKAPANTPDVEAPGIPSVDGKEDENANADTHHAAELSRHRQSNYSIIPRRPFRIHTPRSLRERRVVPSNSDVLRFASEGNVEQLWSLFDRGLASPFDLDEQGFTPLHQAARLFRPVTCKLLVDLGADCNAVTNFDFTPLSLVSTDMLLYQNQSIKHIVDLTRILLEDGDADPELETERGLPIYYSYEGNIDGIKLLINQSKIGLNLGDRNIHGWGVLHEQICYARYHDKFLLERLRFWVSHGANVNAKVKELGQNGFPPGTTPLHVACWGRFDFSRRHRYLLILKPGFLEIFLHADADLHAVDDHGYTIMRYIYANFRKEELVWWFTLLDFLNVDLLEYLEAEFAIHENNSFDPLEAWRESYASYACLYRKPHLDLLAHSHPS